MRRQIAALLFLAITAIAIANDGVFGEEVSETLVEVVACSRAPGALEPCPDPFVVPDGMTGVCLANP